MSIVRHHNEWLSLVPNSGPFLSLPVLKDAFPQELDAHDVDHARRLRVAYHEWDENQTGRHPDPVIHRAWVKWVLDETLGFAELLTEKQAIPETLKSAGDYGETLRPDWVVNDPVTKKARILVQVYPRSQALGKPVASAQWKTSPDTRMTQLLHDTGVRLGIVTNGDHWMLVNVPKNETSGYASWYANLWLEESITLRAFRTLLGADSIFGGGAKVPFEELLDKSAADQQEVTDQLGYQVRKAVEVLIQSLDKADQDHSRKLLVGVSEKVLYESALTVMMRLVFLFCAEERELFLLGDELYDSNYAVSTLREQLRSTADQFGEEILGLRHDAWVRILTTFRVVYAGVKHDRLKLPAYGGSLFHPDRFTFLEGRAPDTSWKDTGATPLPVNNRTVLHLLEALQVLQVRLPGGGAPEARKLSFRELNIEQIGHVYEGLLDHTAKRAIEPMLGLKGTRDKEPEIALAELEKLFAKGEKELLRHLKDTTGRSESALKKELNADIDGEPLTRFRTACQGDDDLWKRVKPFAGMVRLDTVGYPVVITTGSVFVTAGTDRRSSGTHYTPKSLTEPIVRHTLEPLVFDGPAEGAPKEQWKLRPAKELLALRICDMACGSGAFLVQSCRYMAQRLLEAWGQDEDSAQRRHQTNLFDSEPKPRHEIVRITPYGQPSQGGLFEQLVPLDPNERYIYALRIVVQRCIYGVDKNPLAVEMAKLSLWLLTLAKNMPFEFLDHAIRCGDSLVGIHSLDQLRKFDLQPNAAGTFDFPGEFDGPVDQALRFRQEITSTQANTVGEVEEQARLLREANEKIDRLKCVADMLVGAEFLSWEQRELIEDELRDEDRDEDEASGPGWLKAKKVSEAFRRAARAKAAREVTTHFNDSELDTFRDECSQWLNGQASFHWPLEFPEVFVERGGFDAIIGNPPFMGGQKITGAFGDEYREYLVRWLANEKRGSADLCAYFFIRGVQLLGHRGHLGSLATNTIAQGDTREVGLDQLLAGSCVIPRAVRSQPWPGVASLEIALVWVRKGKWASLFVLDDQPTEGITAYLTSPGTVTGNPFRLKANVKKSYQGSNILGLGFVLTPDEAQELIAKDARNKDVLFPYLNGEDLNSRPDQSPSRWVINFSDWPIEKAKEYPDCFRIVEERVKPERAGNADRRRREIWWQFTRPTVDLYQAIAGMDQVLVKSEVGNKLSFSLVPNRWVYSHMLIVFATDRITDMTLLQSTLHMVWSWQYGSTMRTDLRYTPSDCFETFPFPDSLNNLATIGELYHLHRRKLMLDRQEGLTKTYNRFHDPKDKDEDIQKLRELHVEMDHAVAAAYGWTDLKLDQGFGETTQGLRFTICEAARREVLARLLKVNHERYAEEVSKGLHDKKKSKPTSGGAKTGPKATTVPADLPAKTAGLFDVDEVDTAFPTTERDKYLCGLLCALVEGKSGLPEVAYLDCLHIARRANTSLLLGGEQSRFVELAKHQPASATDVALPLPWTDLLELLTLREALRREKSVGLKVGKKMKQVRTDYPTVDAELIRLIHSAAERLRELQTGAQPQPKELQGELREFAVNRRQASAAES